VQPGLVMNPVYLACFAISKSRERANRGLDQIETERASLGSQKWSVKFTLSEVFWRITRTC